MLASTTVRVAIVCFLFLYSFRFHGVGGGSGDNQQFGRATFGARFCPVGRALWSCPDTGAVLCVGRFLRGCLADNSMVRPPPSLRLCLFFESYQVPFTLNFLIYAFFWGGGGSRDNQRLGRATFGARFCPVGRALWSCPVTGAVLCVGRFLRGCLADKLCGSPSPFPLLMPFFSSLFKSLLL
jgi:hypothetical protein